MWLYKVVLTVAWMMGLIEVPGMHPCSHIEQAIRNQWHKYQTPHIISSFDEFDASPLNQIAESNKNTWSTANYKISASVMMT